MVLRRGLLDPRTNVTNGGIHVPARSASNSLAAVKSECPFDFEFTAIASGPFQFSEASHSNSHLRSSSLNIRVPLGPPLAKAHRLWYLGRRIKRSRLSLSAAGDFPFLASAPFMNHVLQSHPTSTSPDPFHSNLELSDGDRFQQIAALLARGIVRLHARSVLALLADSADREMVEANSTSQVPAKSAETGLAICLSTRLSGGGVNTSLSHGEVQP